MNPQEIINLAMSGRLAEAIALARNGCSANPNNVDSWMLLAHLQAQSNDLPGVIDSCGRVVERQPGNITARYNLAVALQTMQRTREAITQYRALLEHEPGNIAARNNLGALYLNAGTPSATIGLLEPVVSGAPDFPPAHNTIGLAYEKTGRYGDAISHFRKAIQLNPALVTARINLCRCLHLDGDTRNASRELDEILQSHPDNIDARLLKARLQRESGMDSAAYQTLDALTQQYPEHPAPRFIQAIHLTEDGEIDRAIRSYESLLKHSPDHIRALNNLATLKHETGHTGQAIALLERAARLDELSPEIQTNLSTMYWARGNTRKSLEHCLSSLQARPDGRSQLQRFAQIMGAIRDFPINKEVISAFSHCLDDPGVNQQPLTAPGIALLFADSDIDSLFGRCVLGELPAWDEFRPLLKFRHAGLFEKLMRNTVLANTRVEFGLRAARHAALTEFLAGDGIPSREATRDEIRFLGALCLQCFNNEYVYFTSDHERQLLDSLNRHLHDTCDPALICIILAAMYGTLTGSPGHEAMAAILSESSVEGIREISIRHFANPRIESELKNGITDISDIDDEVSRVVRDQYEESPYPRWLSVDIHDDKPYPASLRTAFPYFTPPDFGTSSLDILIAGCGTGKHAILSATRFPKSKVTAFDLSRRSIAYGMRKAKELGIDNIRFYCGDILNLDIPGKKFHIIESVGVLHHLRDPAAGLHRLRSLLAPGGLMNLGLYSRKARDFVYLARNHFNVDQRKPGIDEIPAARLDILSLPEDHPMHPIHAIQDFFSVSECRDLLFHVQEHSYDLLQIESMLEEAKLRFIGFDFPLPTILPDYAGEFPDDPHGTVLANWHLYEQRHPDTFTGMYIFWCQDADARA